MLEFRMCACERSESVDIKPENSRCVINFWFPELWEYIICY